MAGIREEMGGYLRSLFTELYAKLQGRPAKESMDIAANLAAATICAISNDPFRRDAIADELCKNVKLLIKHRYGAGMRPEIIRS